MEWRPVGIPFRLFEVVTVYTAAQTPSSPISKQQEQNAVFLSSWDDSKTSASEQSNISSWEFL